VVRPASNDLSVILAYPRGDRAVDGVARSRILVGTFIGGPT
jgi:hypothetical protein